MDREEILQKSRNENKNRDEMERSTFEKAGQTACAVGGFVCMIIIIIEAIFTGQVNCGTWAVYLSMTGTMLLVKYFRLKKKHELVFGAAELILAAIFLVMFVIRLVR